MPAFCMNCLWMRDALLKRCITVTQAAFCVSWRPCVTIVIVAAEGHNSIDLINCSCIAAAFINNSKPDQALQAAAELQA